MTAVAIPGGLTDREAAVGEKPFGPGHELGPFGSLRGAVPEAVADAVVGNKVGDRAAEDVARERFRWVRGISALDRATLGACWLDFAGGTGLVRTRVLENGVRQAERARRDARPRRDVNLPPEPVGSVPLAGPDPGLDAAKQVELASLDDRVRRIVDERLRAHCLITEPVAARRFSPGSARL